MEKILVKKHVGSAFSLEDVEIMKPLIEEALSKNDQVVLDFEGIRLFTTLFFNEAVTSFMEIYGVENFENHLVLENLSETGKDTFEHSFQYGKRFYSMTKEQREEQQRKMAEEIMEM